MHRALRLAATLATGLLLTLPALAADKAMLILDASGSMWAQIEGKSRIEIARETLGQVLQGVSPELELGFMAYGHRTKGDCGDIELLVTPEAGTADRIVEAAMSLNPRGKTPLSDAVRQAAELLNYTEDKASIVLITDGIETCAADPCALASELEGKGIDFAVNVVGFGLSKEEGAAVQCLAENTGGTYLSADDADGLKNAIDVAVNDAPPAPPVDEPVEAPAPEFNYAPVAYLSEGDDRLVDTSIVWELSTVGESGTAGTWVRTEYGTETKVAVEPGDYIATARLDYAQVSQKVTITAGEIAKPEFILNAGHLTVRPIAAEGAEPDSNASVYLEFADGNSTTFYGETRTYLPAGTTKITIGIGAAKLEESVTVAAGERVTKDIVVGVGRANVTASYVAGMKVEDGNLFVEILGAKKDMQGNRDGFGYNYGADTAFDLLPGEYVAVASFDVAKTEQPFTVKAGEAVDVVVALNAGVLFIDAPGASYIEVLSGKKDIQGNRTPFSGVYDVTSTRTLPAGDYHVLVTMQDGTSKQADASVVAGERTEIKVE